MQREIKFRGLRTDGKGWVYGWLFRDMFTGKMCIQQDTYETMCDTGHKVKCVKSREVIPETVGQYTGLKDKNGVEIYEGDYVRCYENEGLVTYKEGSFILVKSENGKQTLSLLRLCWSICEPIEIIKK